MEPEGANAVNADEKNEGGVVIYVADADGRNRQEVTRVGFARRHTRNPHVSFDAQLEHEVGKARTAVRVHNELFGAAGELQ